MKFFEWQLGRAQSLLESEGACGGQVDAEKLAQRSLVAASTCGTECP